MPEAVREAQEFTWQALAGAFASGKGQLIPDRFFWSREAAGE
jgi:hydroxymethylpyrimidine/phosphomethylpyrimidine kinase